MQAIHYDLNGDGTAETRGGWPSAPTAYATAYPTPMTAMGCPARDHDNDPMTADQASCIGYELVNDIDAGSWVPIGKTNGPNAGADFTGKLVGNGYRVSNALQRGAARWLGLFSAIGATGSVEGLGLVNPQFGAYERFHGTIAADLGGSVIGSYVEGGSILRGRAGGIVSRVRTAADHAGLIAHSYSRGIVVGDPSGHWYSGLMAYEFSAQNGTNRARCLNSFSSGTLRSFSNAPQNHGLISYLVGAGVQMDNCYGDTNSTKMGGPDNRAWGDATATENTANTRTRAQLQNPTGYTGAFANWDDYTFDGTALTSSEPRTDFWYFGDSTTFPVLKGWGHDRTEAMARSQSGSQTVNLCTRTLAVANEIIRLLKDDDRAPGVTTTPAAVTALTDCTASTDTRNVSITNLANLVVTSETNPFNLNPDRTSPASAKLTALDMNDFAYLSNATHFNLSGNSLTTLPPRLFQGVPLRWLDLSDNQLTTIPADLFAGLGTVSATTDNMLFLNGNSLTDTGIPGRVFDPLTHINGIDLSDNSLTRVNTRWFEKLVNLGRRLATGAAFQDKLGLHLSGNTITEHYYSNKLFTGIRENVVTYTGATAGDSLRTAIKNAIAAAAGGTTPTTLDIDSTEHFNNNATPPAYLGTADTCPANLDKGPAGHTYWRNLLPPECYVSPKWSPPYVTGAITPAPTELTLYGFPTLLGIEAHYNRDADFIAVQMRYRPTPANLSDPWTQEWMTSTAGVGYTGPITQFDFASPVSTGTSYQLQLRALSRTAPPSTPLTATATTLTSPAAPQGLSATTSTTSARAIELSWTSSGWGTAQSKYQYRSKLSTAQTYGAWTDITGRDYEEYFTNSHTLTGLTAGAQYDIQLRLHWSDAIGASAASTTSATASGASVSGVLPTPRFFNAVPGTAPGTVDLSWGAVPGATSYQYRCNPACTTNDAWVSAGTGTRHTVKFTLKGEPDEQSTLYLRAITDSSQSPHVSDSSLIRPQPGPEFATPPAPGHLVGSIYIEWDPPSAGTVTRYEYAYTLESLVSSDATWYTVPDSDGDNDLYDETEYTITGLRPDTEYSIAIRVLTDAGYSRWGPGNWGIELTELPGTSSAVSVLQNVSANTSETAVGAIRVAWKQQDLTTNSEAKYQVRYKLSSSSWPATAPYGWTDVADGPDTGSHTYDESDVTVTGLMSGQRYDIELRFSPSNTGEVTPAAKVAANASRVPVPTDFNANPGSETGEVDLSWNAITGATGYQYRCNPAGTGCTNTWTTAGTGTLHTVTGLTGGESYSLELRAITATEQSTAATATSAAQTLPGPQNFAAARGMNAGEIDLSWSAPSSGTVTHYEYRFKLASNASYPTSGTGAWAQVPDGTDSGTSLADETAYTITSLWAGVSYNIQLRVNTSTGNSLPFTATHTALEVWAPAGIEFAPGDAPGEIDLVWTAIPSSGLPTNDSVVNYQYRSKLASAGASTYTAWTNLAGGANTTSYTVTGLSTNTLYDVQLRAAIDDGDDQDSAADYHSSTLTFLSARSGIAIPEFFTAAVGVDPGEVDLTWTAQTAFRASATAAKYQYRTKLTSANWPSDGGWTDIPRSNYRTASYTLEGLAVGQRHDIELRFLPTSYIISGAATAQISLSASTVPVPQNVLAATSVTARAIDVSWTLQVATTSRDAKYQVRYKRTSASWPSSSPYGWVDVADGPDSDDYAHNETSLTITGLTADRDYDIELRFHWSDSVGASDAAKVVARASSGDVRAPRVATPTGFDARTGSRQGEIDLYWNAVTGATGYEFRCSRAATGCPRSWSSAGTGTSHTVTGLVSGAFYNIELRALQTGRRASTPTASQRARAQSTTPVQPTARGPASLTFSHGPNPGDLKIDWTAPCCGAAVTHYEYRYKRETESNSAYTAWQTVPDSGDSGNSKADEVTTTITGLRTSTGSFPARREISYHVQFRVYASSSIGYSVPQRGTQTAKPVPPPPYVSCSESTRTPGEVTLEWNPARGVNVHSYVINRRIGNLPWSNVTEATDDTRFVFRSFKRLRAGVRYTFRVSTVMTVGASAPSRSVSCVTPHIPPPSNLRVTTGSAPGELKVSWSPVTGATSYEYRAYRFPNAPKGPWRDFSERRRGFFPTLRTSGRFEGLEEGKSYAFEVRAVIARVGTSGVASGSATARGSSFFDWLGRQSIPSPYEVAPAPEDPGRIAIRIPRATAPNLFIFRHRTANPGQWSRWFAVRPEANQEQYLIPDLQVGVRYEVQVRAYTGPETGFTTALSQEAEATPLEVPEGFEVTESSGIIRLEWASPELYTPDSYEYRSLPAGATTWGDWITVQHQGDRGTTQTLYVPDLESGVEYQFELRVVTAAGNGPVATVRATTRVSLPEINSIRPEVREVTLRAGDTIRLGVDVYNQQDGLDNSIPGKTTSLLVFRWSEQDSGGGSFADPGDGRRVVYTAPSSPGTYTITAEAQPDGICRTHHADASGISDTNRAPCIATFTIRVTSAAGVSDPQPDPVNPAGVIPTELTDNAGTAYTVFTPVDGGTFTGGGFTVSAPAGAVPDRTLLGVTAAVSAVPVPAPVPGASMSLAGSFYDINAIQQSGQPPLTAYTLDDSLTVCLPFPDEFRADLSNVVVVQRQSDGNLSPLTTKVRTNAGILTVCGAVSTLPATVGVAKLGTVPPIPATPSPAEDTPDTGAATPGYAILLLTLLLGVLLTGICRMRRIIL